jgi:hypothetical protein
MVEPHSGQKARFPRVFVVEGIQQASRAFRCEIQKRRRCVGETLEATWTVGGRENTIQDVSRRFDERHRAHFVDQGWPRALARWDTYLRETPRGRFVPEARYSRALALIRMARYAEARRALEPFSGNSLGGYRQREAKALLEELGEDWRRLHLLCWPCRCSRAERSWTRRPLTRSDRSRY